MSLYAVSPDYDFDFLDFAHLTRQIVPRRCRYCGKRNLRQIEPGNSDSPLLSVRFVR